MNQENVPQDGTKESYCPGGLLVLWSVFILSFHQMAQDIVQIILLQYIGVLILEGDESVFCGGFTGSIGFVEGIQILVGKDILKHLLGTGGEVFTAIVEINHSGIDALIGQGIACMGVFPEDATISEISCL